MVARLIFILIPLALGCTEVSKPTVTGQRVISLSPAATSVIVALGAADQLVGISTFCPQVPGASELPRLGGLIDPFVLDEYADLIQVFGLVDVHAHHLHNNTL